MFKLRLGHIHLALLMFMYSVGSLAATVQYRDIFQYNINEGLVALTNDSFERDYYDNINAGFRLLNAVDPDGQYNVSVGSSWTWQLYKKANEADQPVNNLIGEYTLIYQGAVGDCENMWSSGHCSKSSAWGLRWALSCIDEGRYSSKILHNGASIGESEFIPTRFKPTYVRHYSKKSIAPQDTGFSNSAEETNISVAYVGVAGIGGKCQVQLPNTMVKLSNTITPNSGSHNHFTMDTEIGTGSYLALSVNDVLNPDIPETFDTVIEGKTNIYGEFYTKYKAGIYGLQETVTIEARREKTLLYEEIKSEPFTYNLDIKVPDLVPLSTSGVDYALAGSFKLSSVCDDRAHNNSHTDRKSHYLTNNARIAVEAMAKLYEVNTLAKLSLNDASLEFGGFFDKGTLNRDEACHVSHRKGIDVDVNSIDSKGRDIWFDNFTGINGNYSILFFELERYAKLSGGLRVRERGSIHYRFSK